MKQRPTEEQIRQVIDLVREAGPSRQLKDADMASCLRLGLVARCAWSHPERDVTVAFITIEGFGVTVAFQFVDGDIAEVGKILAVCQRVHAVAQAIEKVLAHDA